MCYPNLEIGLTTHNVWNALPSMAWAQRICQTWQVQLGLSYQGICQALHERKELCSALEVAGVLPYEQQGLHQGTKSIWQGNEI